MAKAKGVRIQVLLECTETPGTSRSVTVKTSRNSTSRRELSKYTPVLRKHAVHKKIKERRSVMAKKQTFGDKVLAAKLAQRKLAKVTASEKAPRGTVSSREVTVD